MDSKRGIISIAFAFLFPCLSWTAPEAMASESNAVASPLTSNVTLATEFDRATPKKSCVDACYTYGEGATCACDLSFCSGCDWCQGDVGPGPDWPFGGPASSEVKTSHRE